MSATDNLQGFRLSPRQARLFRRGAEGRQGWSAAVRLAGRADPARLEDALSRLIDGHEILRTDFPVPPGLKVPLQSVREGGFPPPFAVIDARGEPALAEAALRDALEAGFAPLDGRGWRAVLVQGPDADRLGVALSAALADGVTPVLMLSQWLALAADRAAAPAEGAAQFADIAEWLCQQQEDEHAASAAAFWQGIAAKAAAGPLADGAGGLRAGTGTGPRRRVPVVLDAAAVAVLDRWRASGTAVLRARLLAAWAALLARVGGRDSFGIAVTLPGRDLPELAAALGPIDAAVPVAVAVDADRPLGDLAAALDAALADAAHHKFALPDAVAAGPAGALPVGFDLTEWPDLAPWGVLETVEGGDGDAVLLLRAGLTGGRLSLDLLTVPACLSAEAAGRIGRMFVTLLGAADGAEPIEALPLADAEARAEVLAFGRGADLPAAPDRSVLTLIADIAARDPGRAAVAGAGGDLNYGQLWRMAGGIAATLAASGAGPAANRAVGVALPRTPLAIAAILGVLRAGAAYVPVDPSWPSERILAVLTDAGVTAVLAGPAQADGLAAAGLRVIDPESAAASSDEPPEAVPAAQDLAYVIYTSGSTGRPKGVPISHANLLASTRARMAAYDRPVGRYLLLSPLFFDSSVAGLFWTLAQGGALVLPAPGEERDAAALRDLVAGRQVTHLLCLPGLWAAIMDDAWPEDLESLETVIVAGERCTADLVDRHAERLPAVPLYNEYGPTEATVWSTVWRWAGGPVPRTIPIGRPIPGTLIRVLDRAGRPVPAGVAGEILIGGPGVAAGYLNRPDLTAERFRPDPLADPAAGGGILYATGDLGSWQEDGTLLFHGRADDQIKLRGYRIEPGDVEAALASHPAVGRAAVLLREDRPGERRLVAYAAVPAAAGADAESLRNHVAQRLPEWMVPTAVVVLPSLPLLPNGKIDRRALPAPEAAGQAGRPRQAPRTPMERRLSELWGAVLNIDPPGIDDDFFRLGGDSLLGLQMVARARQAGVKLTSAQLFEHPTIARLAEVVEATDAAPVAAPSVPGREVPLTPIQRWLLDRNSPEPHQYNQAIALDLRRSLVRATLEAAAARLPTLYDALTLAFQPLAGGGWRQSVAAASAAVPVTWLEVGGLPAPAREALVADALAKAQSGFRLGQPPLLRFVYVAADGDGPDRLHAIAHHLVVDGLSWTVLMEDLEAGYLALEAGTAPAEPHRSASFADHADALAAAAVALGDPAAPLRRAWAAYLARPVRPLPLDHAAAGNDEAHAGTVTARLDPVATAAFLTGAGPGPHRLLLASVGAVLARYAGGGVLRLDCERHGRHGGPADLDRSRSVGWFTEIHPVLFDLPAGGGTAAAEAALAQIGAVPGDGDGFGLLVRPPAGVEPLAGGGTGEVLVNYLGQVDASLAGSALFAYSPASSGRTRSGVTPRSHLLEIDAEVSGDELRIDWTFATQCHARTTIAALAEEHAALLSSLAVR